MNWAANYSKQHAAGQNRFTAAKLGHHWSVNDPIARRCLPGLGGVNMSGMSSADPKFRAWKEHRQRILRGESPIKSGQFTLSSALVVVAWVCLSLAIVRFLGTETVSRWA